MPIYYIQKPEPQIDTAWLGALSGVLAEAITRLSPIPGDEQVVNFAIGVLDSAVSEVSVQSVAVTVKYIDDSQVQIGDGVYPLDLIVDASLTTALSSVAIALVSLSAASLGLAPASIAVLSIAAVGTVGALYSKFVDPVTDALFDQLAGTVDVDVQLRDPNGEILAGGLYKDGLGSLSVLDAVNALLSRTGAEGAPEVAAGMDVYVDSASGEDQNFSVYGEELLEAIANVFFTGGVDDVINFHKNSSFVAEPSDGKKWVFARGGDEIDLLAVPADDGSSLIQAFNPKNINIASGALFITPESVLYLGDVGAQSVNAGAGDDWIFGGAGDDVLLGEAGDDWIYGDNAPTGQLVIGDDILDGGEGDDTLIGGAGNDVLDGSEGSDTVDYSAEIGVGAITVDRTGVGTFSVTDTFGDQDDLRGIEAITTTTNTESFFY